MTSDSGLSAKRPRTRRLTLFFEGEKSGAYLFGPPSQNVFRTPPPKTFLGGGSKTEFRHPTRPGPGAPGREGAGPAGRRAPRGPGGPQTPGGAPPPPTPTAMAFYNPPAGYSGRRAPGDCCWWGFAGTLPGISFLETHGNCRSQHCPSELWKPPTVAIFTLFVLHQTPILSMMRMGYGRLAIELL